VCYQGSVALSFAAQRVSCGVSGLHLACMDNICEFTQAQTRRTIASPMATGSAFWPHVNHLPLTSERSESVAGPLSLRCSCCATFDRINVDSTTA
jgi:hypothetical protein